MYGAGRGRGKGDFQVKSQLTHLEGRMDRAEQSLRAVGLLGTTRKLDEDKFTATSRMTLGAVHQARAAISAFNHLRNFVEKDKTGAVQEAVLDNLFPADKALFQAMDQLAIASGQNLTEVDLDEYFSTFKELSQSGGSKKKDEVAKPAATHTKLESIDEGSEEESSSDSGKPIGGAAGTGKTRKQEKRAQKALKAKLMGKTKAAIAAEVKSSKKRKAQEEGAATVAKKQKKTAMTLILDKDGQARKPDGTPWSIEEILRFHHVPFQSAIALRKQRLVNQLAELPETAEIERAQIQLELDALNQENPEVPEPERKAKL